MVLSSKVRETDPNGGDGTITVQIPEAIAALFEEPLVITGGTRQLFVTLGQFSIIRLERDAQLIVPILDYAMPCKECCDDGCGGPEDPCEMFSRIPFPAGAFTPGNCASTDQTDNPCKPC